MSRSTPFITKPPHDWHARVDKLDDVRLFLVNLVGPTVFVLKTDDLTDTTFKVFIGPHQRCNCGGGEAKGTLCVHLLFVMIKVLRVPFENPICWQLSLSDSEVEEILCGEMCESARKKCKEKKNDFLRKGHGEKLREIKSKASKEGRVGDRFVKACSQGVGKTTTLSVQQKQLNEDNICSICLQDMTDQDADSNLLCFCEAQCGSNFHTLCFRMYASYKRSEKEQLLCPLCRTKWEKIPSVQQSKQKVCAKRPLRKKCKECHKIIKSTLYRCVCCKPSLLYDLCKECFDKDLHVHDIFVKTDTNILHWETAQVQSILGRPRQHDNHALQHRDLNDTDYFTLLAFDTRDKTPAIHDHLIQALNSITKSDNLDCCICKGTCSRFEKIKELTCQNANHVAHEVCIKSMLIESQSENNGHNNISAACPICDHWIFPMLSNESMQSIQSNISATTRHVNTKNSRTTTTTTATTKKSRSTTKEFKLLSSNNDSDVSNDDNLALALCILGTGKNFAPKSATQKTYKIRVGSISSKSQRP